MTATCETCFFWKREDSRGYSQQSEIGFCRIRSVPSDVFPLRHSAEWCGEHQPREAADA